MRTLKFMGKGGGEHAIEADERLSVMLAAKARDVDGIDADCGGSMVCGTCHVYVLDGADLPAPSEMERTILDGLLEPHPDARLSCQIKVADCADGQRFQIPPSQR